MALPKPAAPGDLERRIERLRQWREAADVVGVEMPVVPRWVEARARREPTEGWAEVIERVEQKAVEATALALAEWERRIKLRLDHLEASAVDGRLERGQIQEAFDSVKAGEVGRALATCRQVDRVVALKERHLDQAREEIGAVVGLMREMAALGLGAPHEPSRLQDELEEELRHGRLAPLKQRIRTVRVEAARGITERLPAYVRRYGSFLLGEQAGGAPVEHEVAELAIGARALHQGHPDEAVHRLWALLEAHPGPKGDASAPANG